MVRDHAATLLGEFSQDCGTSIVRFTTTVSADSFGEQIKPGVELLKGLLLVLTNSVYQEWLQPERRLSYVN